MELKINGNKIFAPLKNKEFVLTPEERVRQEYICRLVNHSGYDLSQMEQELQVTVRFSLPSTLPLSSCNAMFSKAEAKKSSMPTI